MIEVKGARCPLTFEEVQSLCIKYRWFTNGDNGQFERLYNMIHDGANLDEVALVIWICSDEENRAYIRTILNTAVMKKGGYHV